MRPDVDVLTKQSFGVFYGVRDRLLGGRGRYGTCCPSRTILLQRYYWGRGKGLVLAHMKGAIWTKMDQSKVI